MNLALIGLAITVFASTNIDDLLVLVSFFADPEFRPRDVVTGQYAGIAFLFAISFIGSLLAVVIPRGYIGLFGIVPILLGAKKLIDLRRSAGQLEKSPGQRDGATTHARIATVTLVTVADGADNVGVYMPAFAVHTRPEIGVFALVFLVMTGLWCTFAHGMAFHSTFGEQIRRYGNRLAPFVLIGIGVVILLEAHTFGLMLSLR